LSPPLLVVWPEYPPAIGGIQVHGLEFVRFLQSRAVPFVLLTRVPQSAAMAREAAEFDAQAGIAPRRILPRGDFGKALDLLRELTRALRPAAVFSSQIAYAPAFGDGCRVVCRSAGNDVLRPWVGPCDVSYAEMRDLSEAQQQQRLAANAEWLRRAATACDEVVCNSQWTAEWLRSLLGVPTVVITGGVDTKRFKPLNRERFRAHMPGLGRGALVVVAARHVLKKGIDVALSAFARLDREARLVIGGRGPETPRLMAMVKDLGIARRVRFIGPVAHRAMPWLLGTADVVLTPSRTVYDERRYGFDHETMGRVACEAAACGTPVVASRCGGIPEVVRNGETGLLVEPENPEELAAAVQRLIDDPPLRQRIGAAAHQWALETLSFESVNQATLSRLV